MCQSRWLRTPHSGTVCLLTPVNHLHNTTAVPSSLPRPSAAISIVGWTDSPCLHPSDSEETDPENAGPQLTGNMRLTLKPRPLRVRHNPLGLAAQLCGDTCRCGTGSPCPTQIRAQAPQGAIYQCQPMTNQFCPLQGPDKMTWVGEALHDIIGEPCTGGHPCKA